jgi:hypothetical protein
MNPNVQAKTYRVTDSGKESFYPSLVSIQSFLQNFLNPYLFLEHDVKDGM